MVANEATVLKATNLTREGFRHGFSTRHGGVSSAPFDTLNFGRRVPRDLAPVDTEDCVAENLRRLGSTIGFHPERLYHGKQVHGPGVTLAEGNPSSLALHETDGWVARGGHSNPAAVGVRSADCIPILIADRTTGNVAALHAGWRGVVAGIVNAGLTLLRSGGTGTPAWTIALGPSIGPCCFEVGADVADAIVAACSNSSIVARRYAEKATVDLRLAVRFQLNALGVEDDAIDNVGGCTACDPAHFFSYRRDGSQHGCHLSVIVARN